MEDAVKTPNVVEATNKPGLYDKLENLKKRWVPTPVQAPSAPCRPGRGRISFLGARAPGHPARVQPQRNAHGVSGWKV